MGNNHDRAVVLLMQVFEHRDEVLEAPQVDTGFRLIEDGKTGFSCQGDGDLNTLELTAREGGIHFTLHIAGAMQSHLGEIAAASRTERSLPEASESRSRTVMPLKRTGLLECKTDADIGTVGDVQPVIS